MKKSNKGGITALIVGIMLIFALTGCDSGDGTTSSLLSFTIIGYEGPGFQQQLVASDDPNVTSPAEFIGANNGIGTILASGTVIWASPALTGPGTGSFYLYIIMSDLSLMQTSSMIPITLGTGSVQYSDFSLVNSSIIPASFKIINYPESAPAYQELFASTNPGITSAADLIGSEGTGTIQANGNVLWVSPLYTGPADGSYSLYIYKAGESKMLKSSGTITDGKGEVEYSTFTEEDVTIITSSFKIENFPGYSGNESLWSLCASTTDNITDPGALLSGSHVGYIQSSGAVYWISAPPNDTYYLYIVRTSGSVMKTSSRIAIEDGEGTVAYSAFTDVTLKENDTALALAEGNAWVKNDPTATLREGYVLFSDGTLWEIREYSANNWNAYSKDGTWSTTAGNYLTLNVSIIINIPVVYTYSVSGNVLTLTTINGATTTYTKTGGITVN